MLSVGIVCTDSGSDEVFDNLAEFSNLVPFGIPFELIDEADKGLLKQIDSMVTSMFQSFDEKCVVNYYGEELQVLSMLKDDHYYRWVSQEGKNTSNPLIFEEFKNKENLPEVLGSIGKEF
jgi:hypothetical protein